MDTSFLTWIHQGHTRVDWKWLRTVARKVLILTPGTGSASRRNSKPWTTRWLYRVAESDKKEENTKCQQMPTTAVSSGTTS